MTPDTPETPAELAERRRRYLAAYTERYGRPPRVLPASLRTMRAEVPRGDTA